MKQLERCLLWHSCIEAFQTSGELSIAAKYANRMPLFEVCIKG